MKRINPYQKELDDFLTVTDYTLPRCGWSAKRSEGVVVLRGEIGEVISITINYHGGEFRWFVYNQLEEHTGTARTLPEALESIKQIIREIYREFALYVLEHVL